MIVLAPSERRALVFTVAAFLAGICLQVIFKLYPSGYDKLSFLDKPPARFVDVNRARYEEFVAVPGIGPSMAARIIYARESKGAFSSLDDLRHIKGFGQKNWDRARHHLVVAP